MNKRLSLGDIVNIRSWFWVEVLVFSNILIWLRCPKIKGRVKKECYINYEKGYNEIYEKG